MGSGASSKKGRGSGKYQAPKVTPPEEVAEEDTKHVPSDMGKTKETAWHRKHCTDNDMSLVRTLNEAYPFEDSQRKEASKKEQVWNPLGDGVRHDWGNVSVAKMQKKVSCSVCKNHILDRYEEVPFYFCRRCREKGDKHLEMCVQCWNNGMLATGPREKTSMLSNKPAMTDSFAVGRVTSADSVDRVVAAHGSKGKSKYADRMVAIDSGRGSLSLPMNASESCGRDGERRPSNRSNHSGHSGNSGEPPGPSPFAHGMRAGGGKPHGSIPCGAWKGKITEGASARPVNFKLFFDQSGDVSGIGPDNCQVRGTVTGEPAPKVKWTETHSWGTLTMTADFHDKDDHKRFPAVKMKGTFKASDGGGGKFELAAG